MEKGRKMIEVGDMEEINRRCISRKEYLNKYDSNVGYALYVQDNIRKDDYVRLNTGEIVKVIGIKENKLNKKAIYFGIYEQDWFDSMAVENFSDNIIELIEVKDVIKYRINNISTTLETKGYIEGIVDISDEEMLQRIKSDKNYHILAILTKEQMEANQYVVK